MYLECKESVNGRGRGGGGQTGKKKIQILNRFMLFLTYFMTKHINFNCRMHKYKNLEHLEFQLYTISYVTIRIWRMYI